MSVSSPTLCMARSASPAKGRMRIDPRCLHQSIIGPDESASCGIFSSILCSTAAESGMPCSATNSKLRIIMSGSLIAAGCCKRTRPLTTVKSALEARERQLAICLKREGFCDAAHSICLLYTSDAADEEDSVDLGGR